MLGWSPSLPCMGEGRSWVGNKPFHIGLEDSLMGAVGGIIKGVHDITEEDEAMMTTAEYEVGVSSPSCDES